MNFRLRVLVLIVFIFNLTICRAEIVAFDMDETLVQADQLLNSDIDRARELGFDIRTTSEGWVYIVRPGAFEILDFAQRMGFELIMISHNIRPYVETILSDSGMKQYFTRVISQEDLRQKVNMDFELYPNHRNKVYPQWTLIEAYYKKFYNAYILRSIQNLLGNKNIHPYLPATNNAKYPPMFGARVLIDDSFRHIDAPLDFVGINVVKFFADKEEDLSKDWIEPLKEDLKILNDQGWIELYKLKYGKEPIVDEVKILENLSENFIHYATISIFSERTCSNDLNLCVS